MTQRSIELLRDFNDWRHGQCRHAFDQDGPSQRANSLHSPEEIGIAIDWACERIETLEAIWNPPTTPPGVPTTALIALPDEQGGWYLKPGIWIHGPDGWTSESTGTPLREARYLWADERDLLPRQEHTP